MFRMSLVMVVLMLGSNVLSAETLYEADFSVADKGAWGNSTEGITVDVSGTNWTVDVSNSGLASDSSTNDFRTSDGAFVVQDNGGVAGAVSIWSSVPIDVSLLSAVDMSSNVTVNGLGANSGAEFLRFFYQLDGADAVESDFSLGGAFQWPIDVSGASSLLVGFSANVNGTADGWTVSSVSVSTVPEPSTHVIGSLATLLAGCVYRRQRIALRRGS